MIENATTTIDGGAVTLQSSATLRESIVIKGEYRELVLDDLDRFVQAARAAGFDSDTSIYFADENDPSQPPTYQAACVVKIQRATPATDVAPQAEQATTDPVAADAPAPAVQATLVTAAGQVSAASAPTTVDPAATDSATVAEPRPATLSELGRA
jgi:hypothetical protein